MNIQTGHMNFMDINKNKNNINNSSNNNSNLVDQYNNNKTKKENDKKKVQKNEEEINMENNQSSRNSKSFDTGFCDIVSVQYSILYNKNVLFWPCPQMKVSLFFCFIYYSIHI